MFKFRNYHVRYLNFRLLIFVALLCYAGILFLTSATSPETDPVFKQIIGLGLGIFAMAFVALVDYHFLFMIAVPIYCACLGLLLLVELFGANYNNAVRWIEIGSFSFQPSELCKMGLVVFFAAYFSHWSEKEKLNHPLTVFGSAFFLLVPVYLIFKEPDLSTTLVICFSFLAVIYTSRISYKWIFGVLGVAAPAITYVVYRLYNQALQIMAGNPPEDGLVNNYQIMRILAWRHPDLYPQLAYQQSNSIMAIGNGGLNGRGLFNTTLESVKNGNFLVEQETDFIFAVVGEEVGFLGSVLIVLLLFFVVAECFYVGLRAKDLGGRLIAVGVGSVFGFQSFVNIGVASGLLPNTGIPLPFISAGLTSLISSFIGIGLVLNVSLQRTPTKDQSDVARFAASQRRLQL